MLGELILFWLNFSTQSNFNWNTPSCNRRLWNLFLINKRRFWNLFLRKKVDYVLIFISFWYFLILKKLNSRCSLTGQSFIKINQNWIHPGKFKWYSFIITILVAPWCSGYHYYKTSFNKIWIQILCKFKPYWRCVRILR